MVPGELEVVCHGYKRVDMVRVVDEDAGYAVQVVEVLRGLEGSLSLLI